MVKNLPANAGDAGSISGSEDPLEKGMAIHSSILFFVGVCNKVVLKYKGDRESF